VLLYSPPRKIRITLRWPGIGPSDSARLLIIPLFRENLSLRSRIIFSVVKLGISRGFKICIGIIAILIALYFFIEYHPLGWPPLGYSLNFENDQTYSNDKLSMVIENNGKPDDKKLTIHGITTGTNILSSPLATQTGKKIDQLTFSPGLVPVGTNGLGSVTISVTNPSSGKFLGWIYLTGSNEFTIPISLSTEPKIIQAMFLIVIGVLVAIILWELFFIADREHSNGLVKSWSNELPNAATARQNELNAEIQKKNDRIKHINNRYSDPNSKTKILTFDLAAITFGIIAGLVGLLNNNYVYGLSEITMVDVGILLGIGLGIGSTKGLVDR
jgi:hypothetical protein